MLGTQVDVWAVGVLAYELMVGYAPFEQATRLATYEHILYNEPEYPPCLSDEAASFIKAALCKVCVCVGGGGRCARCGE